jgi:hypothetical protein
MTLKERYSGGRHARDRNLLAQEPAQRFHGESHRPGPLLHPVLDHFDERLRVSLQCFRAAPTHSRHSAQPEDIPPPTVSSLMPDIARVQPHASIVFLLPKLL